MTPSLQFLLERRSTALLTGPAPTREQIALMLKAATTVPDHGELKPYRFVVIDSEAGQTRFGDALAAAGAEAKPDLSPGLLDKLRRKAFAAPALVIVIASPIVGHKIPVWEQVTTASCCGYALALAAHALGLGAIWKSANVLAGGALTRTLDLGPNEQLLGWINVGQLGKPTEPRPEIEPTAHVLDASGLVAL